MRPTHTTPRLLRLLTLILLAIPASLLAQQPFKTKLYDPQYNVLDVIREAEEWYSIHGTKNTGYKGFQRWRYEYLRRFYPTGDRTQFNPQQATQEFARFKATQPIARRGGGNGIWTERGPHYADNLLPPSWAAGLGRIEAVWAGANTPDTVYLGSRSGGFFKTTDGGTTWTSTTQHLAALGVMDIEVHPLRRNEVYILTRHATGYTHGILRSTDFGDTWNPTGYYDPNGNGFAHELHLASPDTFFVAAGAGVLRTTDGGTTWTTVYSGSIGAMRGHPTNSQILYAHSYNSTTTIRRTTDGGQTWTNHTITGIGSYPMLAVTPAAPDYLYAAGTNGIFRSTNQGSTWTNQGPDPTNSGFMALGASATNPDHIFAGSLNQYSSTDGGVTWTSFADWVNALGPNYVHADGRVFRAWGNRIYLGTDGFLGYSSDNGVTWNKINNNGTGLREFYRIGCAPTHADMIVGGSQDNGTSVMLDGTWYEWIGADGMQAHVDRNNPDIWFGTIQFGNLQRTTQRGQNAQGITPNGAAGEWITPSVLDPSNENTIFIAYDTVYKSVDNGNTWRSLARIPGGDMDELAIAPTDSNVLYVSNSNRLRRSTDNGLTWTFADQGLPNLHITRIAVHPYDPLKVSVSYSGFVSSGKVFYSTDGGVSWTNLSGNLPNIPANALAWTEGPPVRLFVGMDVGVYYVDEGSTTWTLYADSLPATVINDLEILEGAGLIRAGTWGRGAWEAPLPGREGKPQIVHIEMDPIPFGIFPNAVDSVQVSAVIRNLTGIQSATLRWGTSVGNLPNAISMSPTQADTFVTDIRIPPQPAGTRVYFRITGTAPNGDSARSESIMYRVHSTTLCAAAGSAGTTFDFITGVAVRNLNNTSTQTQYSDFRHIYTDLFRDSTYTIRVSLNYSFPQDSIFLWIDWNNNQYLSEPGEQITMSNLDAFHRSYATFTVPHLATIPDTIVMRVRSMYGTNLTADPCGNYFGEVEDYSLVIRDSITVGTSSPQALPFKIYPNPAQDKLNIICENPTPAEPYHLRLLDLQGHPLMPTIPINTHYTLDISHLPQGMYILELQTHPRPYHTPLLITR